MVADVSLISRDNPTACSLCKASQDRERIQVQAIPGVPLFNVCRPCAAGLAAKMDRLLRVPPRVAV